MSTKDYYHKRIEQPLLIQTTADAAVFGQAKRALQEALVEITKQEEGLRNPVTLIVARGHQSTPQFGNNVAGQAYRTAHETIDKIFENKGYKADFKIRQEIAEATFRIIWNEAIELSAQVTGGTAGTLIRDLKEDRNYNSKQND